jgi:hypothetical protein
VLQVIPAQRDPRQHAQTIDLAADVTVIARLAQQLQRKVFGPAGCPGAEGGHRLLVEPHPKSLGNPVA